MLSNAKCKLHTFSDSKRAKTHVSYFKGENPEAFLGVSAKQIREVAKEFSLLPLHDVAALMQSPIHDERALGGAILIHKYQNGNASDKERIYLFYIENIIFIRDWSNVDASAPAILGDYLFDREKDVLYDLIKSDRLWDRRIAIVATLEFIRKNEVEETLKLAKLLLNDEEDLIHKAAGWMLREVGKRNPNALEKFLNKHSGKMPRTMLRYALERLTPERRQYFMNR